MERLLTTDEVAEYLRVDVVTIRRLVGRGELTAYRIGSEYRFTRSDLEDYLQRQRVSIGTGEEPGTTTSPPLEWVRKTLQGKHTTGRGDRVILGGEVGLTPRAKKVIELSVDEARRLDHHPVGTEHLLLGLIREGEGIAAGVLESQGVKLDQARRETVRVIRQLQESETDAVPPTPPEAARLL